MADSTLEKIETFDRGALLTEELTDFTEKRHSSPWHVRIINHAQH
jgi:hypothetical protein